MQSLSILMKGYISEEVAVLKNTSAKSLVEDSAMQVFFGTTLSRQDRAEEILP